MSRPIVIILGQPDDIDRMPADHVMRADLILATDPPMAGARVIKARGRGDLRGTLFLSAGDAVNAYSKYGPP